MNHAHDDACARIKALRDAAQIYHHEARLQLDDPPFMEQIVPARGRIARRYQARAAIFYSLARIEYECEWGFEDEWDLGDHMSKRTWAEIVKAMMDCHRLGCLWTGKRLYYGDAIRAYNGTHRCQRCGRPGFPPAET